MSLERFANPLDSGLSPRREIRQQPPHLTRLGGNPLGAGEKKLLAPHSTAQTMGASMAGEEWRLPGAPRGSGTRTQPQAPCFKFDASLGIQAQLL